MDDELSTLHAPVHDMIKDNKTWIIKKFGVFKAIDNMDTEKLNSKSKKKKKINEYVTKGKTSKNNSTNNPNISKKISTITANNISPEIYKATADDIEHNINNQEFSNPEIIDYVNIIDLPGYEWISKELREDVLLSAFALQGAPINTPVFHINNSISVEETTELATNSHDTNLVEYNDNDRPTSNVNSISMGKSPTLSQEQYDITVQHALHSFFQKQHDLDSTNKEITLVHNFNESDITENSEIKSPNYEPHINAPHTETGMPKCVIEILQGKLDKPEILSGLKKVIPDFTVPESGLLIHGLARFLLTYYFDNVADLMTVVSLSKKNPWKRLYFPRALAALGDLAGLGYTSNSRNSLLNALLAVSCFNIRSKLPKKSIEQTFFLNLGIEFRSQASCFLKLCLSKTVNEDRYKDVLTAILSMNSIDVVWGTMADCHRHLTLGGEFIELRMKSRPKLSEKAKTLHRIFSFLKLIQDSTALDKINEKEINFDNNDINLNSDITDKITQASNKFRNSDYQTTNDGSFKELLNEKDGKIQIEFIRDKTIQFIPDSQPNDSKNSFSPPIFNNIASESYFYSDKELNNDNIVDIETLYGLPNSLILLFSDCVRIVRHTEYYNLKYIPVPREFIEISLKFEKRLLKWKPEWNFYKESDDDPNINKCFINDTTEGIYHHTMSFFYSLIIYYFSMARDLNNDFLQSYVQKVLKHLDKLNELIENKSVKIVPLIWQGFIAGCACTSKENQNHFKGWAAKLAESGMGSYWGARQVMFEVWNRRDNEIPGDSWFSVYKDWDMNLMLS